MGALMSTITIGRTTVDAPYEPVEAGQSYSFRFDVESSSAAELYARMEQLKGLRQGDVVPVSHHDDRLTGFYRLVTPVALEVRAATYASSRFVPGSVTMARLVSPEIETYAVGAERVNNQNNPADSTQWTRITTGVSEDWGNELRSAGVENKLLGADDSTEVSVYQYRFAMSGNRNDRWTPIASQFYDGLPAIEQDWGTDDWYPVVGFNIRRDLPLRLKNGYLRAEHAILSPAGASDPGVAFNLERLNSVTAPTAYGDPVEMGINMNETGNETYLRPVRILRNDSAAVSVRYRMVYPEYSAATQIVATLYRGEPFVRFRMTRGGQTMADVDLDFDENYTVPGSPWTESAEGPSVSGGWRWVATGDDVASTTGTSTLNINTSSSTEINWMCGFGEDTDTGDDKGVENRIEQWVGGPSVRDTWVTT